jgi:hypothetical protein
MERAGESARVLERIHPHLDHDWRPMLRRGAEARRMMPDKDTPTHARMAFYAEQLEAAFLRGYLYGSADPASPICPP